MYRVPNGKKVLGISFQGLSAEWQDDACVKAVQFSLDDGLLYLALGDFDTKCLLLVLKVRHVKKGDFFCTYTHI